MKGQGQERLGDLFSATQLGPTEKWDPICLASEVHPFIIYYSSRLLKQKRYSETI